MKNVLATIKGLFPNKWVAYPVFFTGFVIFLMSATYITDPGFLPEEIKGKNKEVIEGVGDTMQDIISTATGGVVPSSSDTKEAASKESMPEGSSQNPNTDQPTDTSNWQTYTNEELGYSVKYPENKLVVENSQLLGTQLSSVAFWRQESYQNRQEGSYFSDFSIDVFNSNEQAIEWVNDKNEPNGIISDISIHKAGGDEWVKALEAGDPDHYIYAISKNSKIYQVTTALENLEYLNDLLENFKEI